MAKKIWLWRAWTADKRIADCGVAHADDVSDATTIARMCLGGPLKNSVTKIVLEEVKPQ